MTNYTPTTPSFVFGYWRPWKKDSDFFDSYFNYAKDVSLAKYSADTIGTYINQASKEQVIAINEVGAKMGQGFSMLSDQMENVAIQLDDTNKQLSFINQNLNLQIEQQILTNVLLENISKLLRVPDSEKKRQQHIEMGLKFFANTKKDEDLFTDALEELLAAEELMKQDYFVLHRIGMIYLFAKNHIDPIKALDYFKRAGKYASVESDPSAARLANVLTMNQNVENAEIYTNEQALSLLAAESFEKAAFAAYVIGDFQDAVILGEKAKKHMPNAQNIFMLAKYQIRNGQIEESINSLNIAIDMMPELASACFSEIDFINEPKVLKLLEYKNDLILGKINTLIQQLQKEDLYLYLSDNERNDFIHRLQNISRLAYSKKLIEFDLIKLDCGEGMILKIGDKIYGGIIFYIDDSGHHGLIAAPNDKNEGTFYYAEAIEYCNNLFIDGYRGWYLPSLEELKLLYNKRAIVGGFTDIRTSLVNDSLYWSSTSNNSYSNICIYFNTGEEACLPLDCSMIKEFGAIKVRAIRAF